MKKIGFNKKIKNKLVFPKKYWSMGLGNEVMNYLIEWAKSNSITKKISLLVIEDNERGIKLYGKFGFVREGLLKKDICVHGVYHNHIAMGLYIDQSLNTKN